MTLHCSASHVSMSAVGQFLYIRIPIIIALIISECFYFFPGKLGDMSWDDEEFIIDAWEISFVRWKFSAVPKEA